MVRICIVGMGNIGGANFHYLSLRKANVVGADKDTEIPIAGVYLICVPILAVEGAVSSVRKVAPDALISVESTVQMGTCRKLGKNIVHCPHRWWSVDTQRYGVRQPRVIGGVDRSSLSGGVAFYQSIDIPVHVVDPIEVAELSKVAENAYEYLRIAFAEELSLYCEQRGVPFHMLRQAMNTNEAWRAVGEVREARDGIGGECLPMAADMMTTFLIESAKVADKAYKEEKAKK